jgi:cell division protein FtsQ
MRWMNFLSEEPRKKKSVKTASGTKNAPGRFGWVIPTLRISAVVGFFGVALGGPTWLWQSGWIANSWREARVSAVSVSAEIGLTVKEVLLEGRIHAPRSGVLKALGLKVGDPIMGFDLAKVRDRIEALPWIQSAAVERRLPGVVRVRIVEREPIALWQRKGVLSLVGRNGVPITNKKLGRFRDLLVIVGKDAPRHATNLLVLLASEPALRKRVRAAVRVGARRWNLRLENGIDVRLPENEVAAAWARLADLDRRHGLLGNDIDTIDLRIPDRLIVRTRNDRPLKILAGDKRTL